MSAQYSHTYAMRPIVCYCGECRPDLVKMRRETKDHLAKMHGPPEYDWDDLKEREEQYRLRVELEKSRRSQRLRNVRKINRL